MSLTNRAELFTQDNKMAKIQEEVIIIKLSKLVKDGVETSSIIGTEIQQALEQVVQELVGDSVVVEIEKA